jgi:plasmid stabilization system protein ParE
MSRRLILDPDALRDLDAIFDYLAQRNSAAASHYVRELGERCALDIIRNNDIMGGTQHYQKQGRLRRGDTDALLPRSHTASSGATRLDQLRPRSVCTTVAPL